ncbi:MAG: hypothetical protein B7Z66_11915 [Chromatiales bacterium 21-64-14]|nr:MAG: hypothetical protein B7Z66_11915 [Chromatiales bacterium 21-64-14]
MDKKGKSPKGGSSQDKPRIEIRPPEEQKFWRRPGFNLLVYLLVYLLLFLGLLYFWQTKPPQQARETSYSESLQYVRKDQVRTAILRLHTREMRIAAVSCGWWRSARPASSAWIWPTSPTRR